MLSETLGVIVACVATFAVLAIFDLWLWATKKEKPTDGDPDCWLCWGTGEVINQDAEWVTCHCVHEHH